MHQKRKSYQNRLNHGGKINKQHKFSKQDPKVDERTRESKL